MRDGVHCGAHYSAQRVSHTISMYAMFTINDVFGLVLPRRVARTCAYEFVIGTISAPSILHGTVDGQLFWNFGKVIASRPTHP